VSVTGTVLRELVNLVGIQGVSVAAIVALLAIAGFASKLGTLFKPASKAVHAGSTASNGLAHIKYVAIALAMLSLLGITSINPDAARHYYELVAGFDWSPVANLLREAI